VSRSVVLMAPAKINLTLEVLGRRRDGFHELASVFATVDVRDRVRVAAHKKTLDVRIAPDIGAVAGDDLATRAVRALAEANGRAPFAYVRVKKRIPVAAGLGGGSSDAGAVLRALARLWRLDGRSLGAIGARVGSDVPFFASGAPYALVRGRGEQVEPLPAPPPLWIALVQLRERVSTAEVFEEHRGNGSNGERSAALARVLRDGAATPALVREYLVNDLLAAAERVSPIVADVRKTAAGVGIALAMSGSGPSLFALADDRAHAIRTARRLRRSGLRARATALGVTC
jgi:4-diphosphocytidyl-2-C-methyl-D-erythritol kinase